MAAFQLAGDGYIENLFHLLWTKDPMFHSKCNINLPHTVIYRYDSPAHWYFTSKQGEILKKTPLKTSL